MPELSPSTAAIYAKPSTLADVLRQVQQAFASTGDATPIMVGKKYLDEGVGSAPRVVFVPEPRGKIDTGLELGSVCSIWHSCDVLVRGVEGVDDIERFSTAYALADRVLAYLAVAATGRIEFGDYSDGSPTDVDAYGAEVAFSFKYQRDVRHDVSRWAIGSADPDMSTDQGVLPQGTPATSVAITVATAPQDG